MSALRKGSGFGSGFELRLLRWCLPALLMGAVWLTGCYTSNFDRPDPFLERIDREPKRLGNTASQSGDSTEATGNPLTDLMPGSGVLDGYAAVVNGEVITIMDVKSVTFREDLKLRKKRVPLQETLIGLLNNYNRGLDLLIENKLMMAEFNANGGSIPPKMVEARIEEQLFNQFNGDPDLLRSTLAEEGVTMDDWRERIREELVVGSMKAQQVATVKFASPAAVERSYSERGDEWVVEPGVQVAKIEMKASPRNRKSRMKRLERVRERIESGESTFEEMARVYSSAPDRMQGGLQDMTNPTDLDPFFAGAVSGLAAGEISPVLEKDNKLYLVMLVEERNPRTRSFEEVKKELQTELRAKEAEEQYAIFIDRLKRKFPVREYYRPDVPTMEELEARLASARGLDPAARGIGNGEPDL